MDKIISRVCEVVLIIVLFCGVVATVAGVTWFVWMVGRCVST